MHQTKNGGRRPKVDELLTVAKSYSAQWVRKKIDWDKLEDFKNQGWSVSALAAHFEMDTSSIYRKHLKAEG